jgi:hypothetical protein
VKKFLRSDVLREAFDMTALSTDVNDRMFVAAIQAKDLPFFATQFNLHLHDD